MQWRACATKKLALFRPPLGCEGETLCDEQSKTLSGAERASGELPGRLHRGAGDLAVSLQLHEVGVHLPPGGFDQLRVQFLVAVERVDEVAHARGTGLQYLQHLPLAVEAMRRVLLDPRARLVDDVAMPGAQTG